LLLLGVFLAASFYLYATGNNVLSVPPEGWELWVGSLAAGSFVAGFGLRYAPAVFWLVGFATAVGVMYFVWASFGVFSPLFALGAAALVVLLVAPVAARQSSPNKSQQEDG